MKTGFQIQVACHNYETGDTTYNKEVKLTDLEKFKDLIHVINTQSKTTWNWLTDSLISGMELPSYQITTLSTEQ